MPLRKWAYIAAVFFSVNMLNNWAFAYNISVPAHIILRSFGSVTTMLAGVIRGKKYSILQVLSVVLLTVGVLVSAWADSEGKVGNRNFDYECCAYEFQGKTMSNNTGVSSSEYTTGLAILLVAQLLSAYMGAYVEDIYSKYGASWTENLFYAHFLSVPFFIPLSSTLRAQYAKLAATPHLEMQGLLTNSKGSELLGTRTLDLLRPLIEWLPQGILFLLVNAATQLACISGVNLLSAKTSAVTVTIVLNIRKLVSFIFSTILFGHQLSGKMILGSSLVFGSGALYGWETSWRLPRERKGGSGANGSLEREK